MKCSAGSSLEEQEEGAETELPCKPFLSLVSQLWKKEVTLTKQLLGASRLLSALEFFVPRLLSTDGYSKVF